MATNKTIFRKIQTRRRLTIPFDLWMDANMPQPKFLLRVHAKVDKVMVEQEYEFKPKCFLNEDASYRFTLPAFDCFKVHHPVQLKLDRKNRQIIIAA